MPEHGVECLEQVHKDPSCEFLKYSYSLLFIVECVEQTIHEAAKVTSGVKTSCSAGVTSLGRTATVKASSGPPRSAAA